MQKKQIRIHPIDMSLRLWSDDVPLMEVLPPIDANIAHLHLKGEPIAQDGSLTGRLAKRHYASLAKAEGNDAHDVCNWLIRIGKSVAAQARLVDALRAGTVEAVFWIAVLGGTRISTPTIETAIVDSIIGLPARILIENYTAASDHLPVKQWISENMESLVGPY